MYTENEQITAQKLAIEEEKRRGQEEKDRLEQLEKERVEKERHESMTGWLSSPEGKAVWDFAKGDEMRNLMFQIWDYFFNKKLTIRTSGWLGKISEVPEIYPWMIWGCH